MKGYRDNPEANTEAFTADGWFRTGDLATIDESGNVTIADRLKELIKVITINIRAICQLVTWFEMRLNGKK